MAAANRHTLYRKAYIFFNCLLLSLVLWFLTTMNRVHSDRVKVPVRYTHMPEGLSVVNELPGEVTLTIEAKGFKLLANRIAHRWDPLDIKVDPKQEVVRQHRSFLVVPLNGRIREIISQMGSDIRITNIEPDSLYFQFDGRSSRKVPVKFNGALDCAPQYGQSGPPRFSPDSVVVAGSEKELEHLEAVMTEFVQVSGLQSSYSGTVSLKPTMGCSYSVSKVEVTVPVEQLTEKKLTLDVVPADVPDSLEMTLIPAQVDILLQVPLSQYQRITGKGFSLVARYPQQSKMKTNKVIVQVASAPPFVKVLRTEPASLEYIIRIR